MPNSVTLNCAVRVELDAQHVVDADARDDRAEQLGVLRQHRAHQQAAVRAALDREPLRAGVPLLDQICAAAMKSSKTFCFFVSLPCACHSSPNSPPPRRLAIAKTPPASKNSGATRRGTPASG